MPVQLMDACAMIAFLRNEPGADVAFDILTTPANDCYAHAIHLCEVYRWFLTHADAATAQSALVDLERANIVTRYDIDDAFWRDAAEHNHSIRAAGHSISFADCFGIALTRRLVAGTWVTTDHHEFDYVQQQGICAVRFIR